jgi:hypothetical protein
VLKSSFNGACSLENSLISRNFCFVLVIIVLFPASTYRGLYNVPYTVKKVTAGMSPPSNYYRPGNVWLATSRRDGKIANLFYSVMEITSDLVPCQSLIADSLRIVPLTSTPCLLASNPLPPSPDTYFLNPHHPDSSILIHGRISRRLNCTKNGYKQSQLSQMPVQSYSIHFYDQSRKR